MFQFALIGTHPVPMKLQGQSCCESSHRRDWRQQWNLVFTFFSSGWALLCSLSFCFYVPCSCLLTTLVSLHWTCTILALYQEAQSWSQYSSSVLTRGTTISTSLLVPLFANKARTRHYGSAAGMSLSTRAPADLRSTCCPLYPQDLFWKGAFHLAHSPCLHCYMRSSHPTCSTQHLALLNKKQPSASSSGLLQFPWIAILPSSTWTAPL